MPRSCLPCTFTKALAAPIVLAALACDEGASCTPEIYLPLLCEAAEPLVDLQGRMEGRGQTVTNASWFHRFVHVIGQQQLEATQEEAGQVLMLTEAYFPHDHHFNLRVSP